MKLSTKAVIVGWVILLAALGSLVYSAYSKLNPDSLVALFNSQIQRSYPASHLSIGKIDYVFSIDFKLSLKNLSLTKDNKTLASADEVQFKIPWWLILLNRGNASININNLDIFVSSDTRNSLESLSSGSQPNPSVKIEAKLPSYLLDAHYTLRAKNISIKELDGDRRYFSLSKLLVREFQYGKNSAFELNIPISIAHKNKRYSSDLWLFGDVTPEPKLWAVNYRGEFKTKDTVEGFQFEDLVIDGKSNFNPTTVDLNSSIELLVEKKKIGTGEISVKSDQIQFHLKFSTFPMHFLRIVGDEIKNPFWNKIEGVGEGEVHFSRSFSAENTSSLSAKLHFPGDFTLGPDHAIPGQWYLDFKNEIWQTSFISPKQDLKFSRRAVLDFDKSQLTQYSQEIGFNSCDLKAALFSVQSLFGLMEPAPQPYHSTVVLFKQCLLGEKLFDGSFRFGIIPNQKYYQAELQDSQSKMILKYSSKSNVQDFSLELSKFVWDSSYKFLEPFFNASEGVWDGKIEGQWSTHWSEGTWLANLKADNLKAATGDFFTFNQNLWTYFNLDSSSAIKKSWQASVSKQSIKLTSLSLDGTDPAHLTGVLSNTIKAKSFLTLSYPKNKKWKPVRKEILEAFWKKETP
jgi:hypothetical protein